MSQPELAVLISTYQRPRHLQRVLAALAVQEGVAGAFEVVVTDDGSTDETPEVVWQFAKSAPFPLRFTTHAHDGFQLARCRNEGVAASRAPYILFLDGDCLVPRDHLRVHLEQRREGYALAAYCIYLDEEGTEGLTISDVQAGRFMKLPTWRQQFDLQVRHWRARSYEMLRDRRRPKLPGGNIGISRADYEYVNGYDENFQGWGCEDDDLRLRLRAAGIRIASISNLTNTFHMWHPKSPSAPAQWREGPNVDYLRRQVRLTRCLAGLTKRSLADVAVQLVGGDAALHLAQLWLPNWCWQNAPRAACRDAEIEFAFAGLPGQFSSGCACRVLVIPPGRTAAHELVAHSTVIFAERAARTPPKKTLPLCDLERLLHEQLGFRESPPAARSRVLQAA